jgi:hypothetical protein
LQEVHPKDPLDVHLKDPLDVQQEMQEEILEEVIKPKELENPLEELQDALIEGLGDQ